MHVEKHQVRLLDELLHAGAESRHGGSIKYSVVGGDTEVDGLCGLPSVSFRGTQVLDPFGVLVCLSNSDDGGLGAQDGRHEVSSAQVTN